MIQNLLDKHRNLHLFTALDEEGVIIHGNEHILRFPLDLGQLDLDLLDFLFLGLLPHFSIVQLPRLPDKELLGGIFLRPYIL